MKKFIKENLRRQLRENNEVTGRNLADALKQFGLTDTSMTVNVSNEKTGQEDVLTVVADENGNIQKGGLEEISTLGKIVISCVVAISGLASCTKSGSSYLYQYKSPNPTDSAYSSTSFYDFNRELSPEEIVKIKHKGDIEHKKVNPNIDTTRTTLKFYGIDDENEWNEIDPDEMLRGK